MDKDGAKDVNIIDVLMKGLKKSRRESRTLVEQGGVQVGGSKANLETTLSTEEETVVKYGKRSYARIRWR